jgi:FAD/FMN-containing dehydrogenase/Fe-S oxidoreductase
LPKTQEDLIAAVELAAKYRIPILPRGSGSSLAGQAIGPALILDCSRHLSKILEFNPEARTAKVEPGVVLATLNRLAAKHGLMFGPDPASAERATLGGVIGDNATGAHSILYGMTADHLLSADVLLSDGSLATFGEFDRRKQNPASRFSNIVSAALEIREKYADVIRENWPRTWRNSAGYRLNYLLPWSATQPPQWMGATYPTTSSQTPFNLASLLAGSEGTLAVIRAARVNLVSKPKNTILGVLSYASVAAACDAVPDLLKRNPSAVELVPQMLIRLARSVPAYASQLGFVRGDPAALLVVEFSGADMAVLREKAQALSVDVLIAESAADQAKVWAVRKVGLGIFDSRPAAARPMAFIEDCAIPVERLGDFVREVGRILTAHGTDAAFYAHASAGCLHIRPILNLKTAEGVRNLRSIAEQVLALTLRVGGAMASEHGDGMVRSEWLRQEYGDQLVEAMKNLKRAADPESLLNPKNLFAAPPMDTHLRYGSQYRTRAWTPGLDFSRNGGLAGAIEQCNGQGVCRKDTGVMCPSFQATREEQNSTRGRANLLRAMITVSGKGLPAEHAKQALDLCLACKGCKAECPSGVDLAKLKYEFQAQYYATHRRPLRDYLFGYIGTFARLGAPLGGLVNWVMDRLAVRKLVNWVFGISSERLFPKFAARSRFADSRFQNPQFTESCLLLPDTFTHFFEPEVEAAALKVLAACGIEAKILPVFGAGRTLISKGFIEPAKRHAAHLLDEIHCADPSGVLPIVGLEPSEIYTLRDEMFDLLPERHAEIEALAARAWLIDEFLIRPFAKTKKLRVANVCSSEIENQKSKILLHGHCYQKAQPPHADGYSVGVNASAELLRLVGYEVEVLNTGCCGMAGAFGYETEHYDVSMQVGELVLLPAVRKAQESGQQVVALGTSCRSQIADGAGVAANHSVIFVAQALYP